MASMIRLFGSELTSSTTFNTNGLGVLSEAISCTVREERNGEFELEMEYPVTGKLYSQIALRNIIVAKPNPYSNPQPFRIYSVSKPLDGIIKIDAEHISYDLSGYAVKVLRTPAAGVSGYFAALNRRDSSDIIVPERTCPFTFWTNATTTTDFRIEEIVSVRNALSNHSGSILDRFNGEYEWDGTTVKFYELRQNPETLKYTEGGRGADRGVSIRYGKNLTNFQQEENCQNVYTGVYPFWHYDDFRHDLVELPYPHYVPAEGTYSYTRILPLDVNDQFARRPTTQDLEDYCRQYMKANGIGEPNVSFDVEFVPLSQTTEYKEYAALEEVHLCDTVNVFFPLMNVNVKAKVTRTEYDAIGEKYESISLGNYRQGIADTLVATQVVLNDKTNSTLVSQAILEATQLLTGNEGGYVVFSNPYNNPESPNEILVMSEPDITSETNHVWRWNQNGLAYSDSGYYADPESYQLAITSNGEINASMITTGILQADRIAAGSIGASHLSVEYQNSINGRFETTEEGLRSVVSGVQEVAATAGVNAQAIADLRQTLDAFKLSFSTSYTGGINKIQNSSGANGTSNDWIVTPSNSVYPRQEAEEQGNTDSGSAFEIRNGTLSQTISVRVGEWYTFSLKYKSYTPYRSYAYVKDGDRELYAFDIGEITDWTTAQVPAAFQATSDQIEVVCGTIGEYLLVADLMLSAGTTRQNWTPAPNEIYTTNVQIDRRGINISNPDSETSTIIDNTKFAVMYRNQEVLTVNKERTLLQKTEIADSLTIGNKVQFVPASEGVDLVIV